MSKWTDTIEFINNLPVAYHFTPVDVKSGVGGNWNTIGIYVNYLHKAGYIQRIRHGIYIQIKTVPTTLTLTKLKSFCLS